MAAPRFLTLGFLVLFLIGACSPGTAAGTAPSTITLLPYDTPTHTRTPTPIEIGESGTPEELLPTATPFVHRVEEGETLLDITLEYGVTLDELLAANPGIDPRFLSIGQELRIPGTGGSNSDSLLPTSTPLPLPVDDVICERQPSELLSCIVTLTNPTDRGVEGMTARLRLIDSNGAELASSLAYAPLNLLPADSLMPLVASFAASLPTPAVAMASVFTAVQAREVEQRYVAVNLENLASEPLETGRRWQVSGQVSPAEEAEGPIRLSVLVMGLDQQGRIVGFTKWAPTLDDEPPWSFEVQVQSLRGPIDRIEVLAEAAPRAE